MNIYVIAYVAELCSIASSLSIHSFRLLPHASHLYCAHVFFTLAAPFNFCLYLSSRATSQPHVQIPTQQLPLSLSTNLSITQRIK